MYIYKKISKYRIFILQVVCGYWVMGSTKANLSWQIGAMRFFRPMCSCGFSDRVPMGVWIFKFLCYRGLTFSNPWVGTYSGDHMLLLSICTNLYTFRSTTFFCLCMKLRVHGVWFFELMISLVFKVELWIPSMGVELYMMVSVTEVWILPWTFHREPKSI